MASYDALLRDLRGSIPEVDVQALAGASARPAVIDCREADEHAQGAIPGAIWIPRGFLESRIEKHVADRGSPIVVYCASGNRSLFAVRTLGELGYTNVRAPTRVLVLEGARLSDRDAGHAPPEQQTRYTRHVLLPEIGVEGQLGLLRARVLLLGAGGLGSPAALYLAAAGVGTLGVVDADVVDASNLQRQVLHATDRVGQPKVASAERTIRGLNPDVTVVKFHERLTTKNVVELSTAATCSSTGSTTSRPATSSTTRRSSRASRWCTARLPVRGPGHGLWPGKRAVLPVPVPRAPAARGRALVRRGRGAGRLARSHRDACRPPRRSS